MELSARDQQVLSFIFDGFTQIAKSSENLNPSKLEIEAVALAEAGQLEAALDKINAAIAECPTASSPLNNKAQILTLMNRDDEALLVLNDCLSKSPDASIRRLVLAQRAWILYRTGDTPAAFKDFDESGKLGCLDSKRMAVQCNPYAKLCNEMLLSVLKSENKTFFST